MARCYTHPGLVKTLWFELCTTLLDEGYTLGLSTNCNGNWHALIETKGIIPNQNMVRLFNTA